MGRTLPTFVQLVEAAIQKWQKFRRALRREDQEHFDRLFRRVRCYTQAATYQCNDNPMEAILLSIALDQEKRITRLETLAGCGHAPDGMDSRSLPLPAGNDPVAARAESDGAQTD
jgi:hypothetical protein